MDLSLLAMLTFFGLLVLGLLALAAFGIFLTHRNSARLQEQLMEHARLEHELKRDLVAKGMPTDEIERIVRATNSEGKPMAAAGKADQPIGAGGEKARLIQILCGLGFEAPDIERLLHAVGDFTDDELPARIAAIQTMVGAGMEAADVERVLRAFQHTSEEHTIVSDPKETAFRK